MGLLLLLSHGAVVVQAAPATATASIPTPTLAGDIVLAVPVGVGGISTVPPIQRRDAVVRAPSALAIAAPVYHEIEITQGDDEFALVWLLETV